MRRALLCGILVTFESVLALTVILSAEEPQKDPLREALEALNRDAAALRNQLEGGKPAAEMNAVAAPANVAAPAMGRPVPSTPTKQAAVSLPPPATTSTHWAFQPVKAPASPAVRDAAWPAADLDRFLLAKLEAADLKPGADADPATLCRRLYLDLTGLLPTAEEAAAFASQHDAKEYEALVDKLLASPRFGERWARHWLDVVRYADSVGRSWNAPFTYAWRYRDYVIDAFNADVPYDRFIAEQLAGDLLSSSDVEERRAQLTGLGFLGFGSLDLRGDTFQLDQIDDQIDVTTRAFLGLTIACARCHDHKYDPVTMHDYYALAGIFQSTDTLPGQADRHHLGSGGYVDPERLVRLPSRGGATDGALSASGIHSMSDYQRAWSSNRNVRYTTDPNLAMGATEGEVGDCELRIRGEQYDYGPAVPRGDVRIPSLPRLPPIPSGVSGRLELARWIGSRNPLTSRVMVNRVWRHLFGRGLVPTVDDFGTTGEAPTHPELLDHLAADFAGNGWSQKRLIRTIVLSRTYRLASSANAANVAVDPDNRLYWRQNLRALELEPLRDSLLFVSGKLEPERPYGIQVTGAGGKQGNRSLLGIDAPYRTIYLPVMRSLVPDVYGTFDFPDPTQIKGSRDSTTVAPQALFLMNDRFVVDCARSAAERLLDRTDLDDAGRVRLAYLQLYGRAPTSAETAAALALIDGLDPDGGSRDPQLYRWTALIQALLAGSEFRFVR